MRRTLLLLPLLILPACEWRREQQPDSPPVSIYSIFGKTWGWEGARPLSHEEIVAVHERLREQDLRRKQERLQRAAERAEQKEELKRAREELRMRERELARARDNRHIRQLERRLSPAERYKQMGSKPSHMIVKESSSYLWGAITQASVHEYPVSWHNSDDQNGISVTNTTNQTLFIDLGADPGRPKELYGIKKGKTRIIPPPPYNQIILWKKQLADEPVDKLITMIRLVTSKQSLVIEERESGDLYTQAE